MAHRDHQSISSHIRISTRLHRAKLASAGIHRAMVETRLLLRFLLMLLAPAMKWPVNIFMQESGTSWIFWEVNREKSYALGELIRSASPSKSLVTREVANA